MDWCFLRSTMVVNGSWPEWIACMMGVAGAVIAFRKGTRWGMAGVVALVVGGLVGTAKGLLLPAAIGSLALLATGSAGGWWKWAGLVLALGGALASGLLCALFPLPEMPPPAGAHPVGTLTFELAADGPEPALLAQVWYPAVANKAAPRVRWLPDPELAPRFPFHRIGKALAGSRTGVELAEGSGSFPVVFYEHSWAGHRAENVAQVEDLASRGFVVVAVDHPGQAARVRYRDGSVIASRLPATLDLSTGRAVEEFGKLAEQCLAERGRNLERVREALARGIPTLPAGRLGLERLGVFGFSFGGTSALRLCAADPAFHAGANEDGLFLGDAGPRGPFLFFDQEMPDWLLKEPAPDLTAGEALTWQSEARILKALEAPGRERVILEGTRHESFSDRIFTCRIPRLAHLGTRPAAEVHGIITGRLGGFFESKLISR